MSKYVIVTTLIILALLLACDRQIDSRDPVRSVPTPVPTPISLQAIVDDATVTLSWELADSSGAALFRIYAAESEEGGYLLRDSTTAFSITLAGLLLNQRAFLRVTTVTSGDVESQPSTVVAATPTHFTISINDNSDYTKQRDVQVRINSGVSAMYLQISEQQDFGDATWESYGASRSFELSEDDGVKTVYVRMQFADGSETGQPLSDDITLDTEAEIESLTFFPPNAPDPMTEGEITTFRMVAGEIGGEASVSFGSESNLELFDDGTNGDAVADDATYTREYTVPFGAYAFDEIVTGSFTDEAGNSAEEFIAEDIMNINSTPEAVTLAADIDTVAKTVVFSWSSSSASDFESYRLYQNGQSPVDTNSTLVAIFTSSGTTEYETSYSTGSFYRLFVFDKHGAAAGSTEVQVP